MFNRCAAVIVIFQHKGRSIVFSNPRVIKLCTRDIRIYCLNISANFFFGRKLLST